MPGWATNGQTHSQLQEQPAADMTVTPGVRQVEMEEGVAPGGSVLGNLKDMTLNIDNGSEARNRAVIQAWNPSHWRAETREL